MSGRAHRTSIWPTRLDLTGCYVHLAPHDEDRIEICIPAGGGCHHVADVSRAEARMLARRLNECLDATVLP